VTEPARGPSYSLALSATEALLGEPLEGELALETAEALAEAATFEHSSLAIELARPRAAEAAEGEPEPEPEPARWYPNCGQLSIDGPDGHQLITYGSAGGYEALEAGARRTRRLDLGRGFPVEVLDVGEFALAYTLEPDGAMIRVGPVRFRVFSGPGAVPLLIDRLESADLSTRCRAASLLHRLTARATGFDPEAPAGERELAVAAWRRWWAAEGRHLGWRFDADRATFAPPAAASAAGPPAAAGAAAAARGRSLGGVVQGRSRIPPIERLKLWKALEACIEDPRHAEFPALEPAGPEAFLEADGRTLDLLCRALLRLAEAVEARPEGLVDEAERIVRTVGRVPDPALAAPLGALELALPRTGEWRGVTLATAAVLDFIDPARVPVTVARATGP